MQIIQNRREIDDGFSPPKLDNGDIVTEQMNVGISDLYMIHNISSSSAGKGGDGGGGIVAPESAKEQYLAEHGEGTRLLAGMAVKNDSDELEITIYVDFSSLAV